MHAIDVSVKGSAAARVRRGSTVGEVLGQLAADLAGQALAARVDGREVDLAFRLEPTRGDSPVEIEPILASTRDGLEVLRHSTAHLLAAAVLDLFPGTKLGIGPALLDEPRFGFFYDVIAPARSPRATCRRSRGGCASSSSAASPTAARRRRRPRCCASSRSAASP